MEKYDQIHMMLGQAQRDAEDKAFAFMDSDLRHAIEQRIQVQKMNNLRAEQGIMPITNRY
jgi:hypothetical protein